MGIGRLGLAVDSHGGALPFRLLHQVVELTAQLLEDVLAMGCLLPVLEFLVSFFFALRVVTVEDSNHEHLVVLRTLMENAVASVIGVKLMDLW